MNEEQLFRLQCSVDVQKKLETFGMEEAMRMAYEPVIIEAVAWIYAQRVATYCSENRVEEYKKTTRHLRELWKLYKDSQQRDLTWHIMQKIQDGAREWTETCVRDLSVIWFSVNNAMKKDHYQLGHLAMRTDAYMCLLIVRLYNREDDRIAETIAKRLKQPKKNMPNTGLDELCLLMQSYLDKVQVDYDKHEENALGILRNDLQYVDYGVKD